MIIKNEKLNIDSIIVQTCDDYEELYNWKQAVMVEILHAKDRLDVYKKNHIVGQEQPVKWDYDWFLRTKKFKSIQGIFHQQIQKRLGEVKKQDKAKKNNIRVSNERLFWKKIVKSLVDEEKFIELCIRVDQLRQSEQDEIMEVKRPRKRIGSRG